jgi:anti-sigma regulatory factor (Ser/Thr protein kinase)
VPLRHWRVPSIGCRQRLGARNDGGQWPHSMPAVWRARMEVQHAAPVPYQWRWRCRARTPTPGASDLPRLLGQRTGSGAMKSAEVAKPGTRVFLGSLREIRSVREFVAEMADGCPAADDLILLASEISANAVVHTASGKGGTFTVVVHPGDAMIRVEVHDGGSDTAPDARSAGEQAGSGRGLGLVEMLATRWGHLGGRDGRVVWFEVEW